ncbi:MAG: 50S ribosomal protein L4 [Armatimonadetes bacterium]|nr:50S ribosomal protein L4 [Armatimonadota bacterium]
MSEIEVKDKSGKKSGSVKVSEKLAKATTSGTTVHRTIVSEESAKRQGTQSAKTRSEVKGGGKKPYRQKKTGRARQGTTRAPHYAHGGMALAVKPRDYDKKVNKKERRAAILTVLAEQIEAGNVTVVESFQFTTPKTADAVKALKAVGVYDARRLLIVLPEVDTPTYRSLRNLGHVVVKTAPSSQQGGKEGGKTDVFSARDLMVADRILVVKEALERIQGVWA